MLSLKDQRAAAFAAAQAIVDACKGRDFTPDEQGGFDSEVAKIKALDEQIAKADKGMEKIHALGRLGPNEAAPSPDGARGMFTADDQRSIVTAVKSRTAYRFDVDRKTLTGAPIPPSGAYVSPGIYAGNATALADLFPSEQAGGAVVRYYRMSPATAGVVAEGALKMDSGVGVTAVDLALTKLATTAKISSEFSEDAGFLVGVIQSELVSAVVSAENTQILATMSGTSGIATATGTAATAIDVLADGLAAATSLNGDPVSAIVVTPQTLATIRKTKASTSGVYALDPTEPGPTTIHGTPVVATPNLAAGTCWLIQPGAAIVYRRGPISVNVGLSDDDWTRNLATMIAEERMGLAVVRPSKLMKITLT